MSNKYYEKILKQITIIKVSLILSILLFTLINFNKLLVLILFSLLTATSLYRLIAIKLYLRELLKNKNDDKEIEVKEQELINCYNKLTLKEKDYFANEPKTNNIQEEQGENKEKVPENEYIENKECTLAEEVKEVVQDDLKETKEVKEVVIEPIATNDNKKIVIAKEKQVLTHSFVYTMDEQQSEKDEVQDNIKKDTKIKKKTEKKIKKEVEKTEEIDLSKCIRKLPKGKKASESAIKLAKEYGYELKEGETFVKPRNK